MRTTQAPLLLDRHGKPLRRNGHVRAKYEAGWTSTFRSWAPMPIQSAAKDILGDRQSLMAHARRWDQNSPLVHGILERLATYTIGTGIFPVPGSASARWNKQVARMWADWSRRPEITDRFSWGTVQRILWRSVLRDGDSFLLLTTREDGAPAVQMIEAHRIRDPLYTMKASLDPGDGVIRDQDGRHLAYKLVRESDGILERQLDGDAVVQFLLPERPDQPRGVTILASALKTIHNLDDILRLEQVAVKDASSKVDIIKTATGEIDQGQVTESDEDISEPATHQDSMGYYNNIFGPETKVLQHGDEFTPYKSDRPSPAWQGFVTYLTDHIALSTGIPPSVLIPAKVGGADTRRELAAAARTLEAWQWMQADSYQRVYEFVIGTWLDRGEIGNAPKDWRRCRWQMPRSITADAGRESQADLNLVTAGLLTLEDYFGSQGWTGREKIEQIAAEQEFVRDLDPTGQLSTRLYSKVGAVQTIGEAFTYPATPEAPEESDGSDKPEEPKDENETDDQDDQPDNVDAGQ